MKGYRCKNLGLWRIPLKDTILNKNMKTHFKDAQINYNRSHPVETTAQYGYTNQANIVEQVLQEIETRKQHEAYFSAELDIHKEIKALKQ